MEDEGTPPAAVFGVLDEGLLNDMGQSERFLESKKSSYVEDREKDEREEDDGVPVMLNCWDWARMATPVGFGWTKLIWKPWPVGQPEEGAFTVVEPEEVVTPSFKEMLTFGYATWGKNGLRGTARKERTNGKHEC